MSEILTVEPFMSGHEGTSQLVTCFVRQILEVLFAPLAKFVFHLLGATRVSLRTYSKVLPCETHRKTRVSHSASHQLHRMNKASGENKYIVSGEDFFFTHLDQKHRRRFIDSK